MGFPTRTTRVALGPERVNKGGIRRNPSEEWAAEDVNTLRWMFGACGLLLPMVRAELVCAATTGALTIPRHFEGWDPDDTGLLGPAAARTSLGVFTLTYPATALDENGNSVSVVLRGAIAAPQDTGDVYAKAYASASNVLTVKVWAAPGGSLDDAVGSTILVVGW